MKPVPPKFNPVRGRLPVLQYCAPDELRIDPKYQRGLDGKSLDLVARIAREWDWDLYTPLTVARRANGALFVIDGQHRLAAALRRGDLAQLPCVVTDSGGLDEEAARFVRLNRDRKPLTRIDLFRAAVVSGDKQAAAISRALGKAGLQLAPHTNWTAWKPGMVAHVGGIEREWNRRGAAVAEAALLALGQGFAGQVQRYAGTLFRGVATVCGDEMAGGKAFAPERFERLVDLLASRTQDQWNAACLREFRDGTALFQGEAVNDLMRREWRAVWGQRAPTALPDLSPRIEESAEWRWCEQCDARRDAGQVAACRSPFCKLKGAA